MKVAIHLTVEVDRDAWARTFGVARHEVRDDIHAYVLHSVQELSGIEETEATVEQKT